MVDTSEVVLQVKAWRELAQRARRLAQALPDADRIQLLEYSEELEQKAAALEATKPEDPGDR